MIKRIILAVCFQFVSYLIIAQIPTGGLSIWLRADAGVTTVSGGLVSVWANQSTVAGLDATISDNNTRPGLITNVINSKPVIRFDGGDLLSIAGSSLTAYTDFTIFVVGKPNAGYADYGTFISNTSSYSWNDGFGISDDGGSGIGLWASDGDFRFAPISSLSSSTYALFGGYYSNTTLTSFINGSDVFSGITPAPMIPSTSNLVIGADNGDFGANSFEFIKGDIAEIIIYNRLISNAERLQIENYLNTKYLLYGLPTPIVSNFSPASGMPGSTIVTINGTNFTGISDVKFNTSSSGSFNVLSTTQILALVPFGATSGPITVYNGSGSGTSASSFNITVTGSGAPIISFVSPKAATPGNTITINGNYFNTNAANNVVYFGATRGTVSGSNANTMQVRVPQGATNQVITALNTATNKLGSSPLPFVVSFPGGSLQNASLQDKAFLNTNSQPYNIVVSDLDVDGRPDVIVSNYSSNTISIYRNNGSSTTVSGSMFDAKFDLSSYAFYPFQIAIGDLDNDGRPDIAIPGVNSSFIRVYKNKSVPGSLSGASFATGVDVPTTYATYSVGMSDIDYDGFQDLVSVNFYNNNISLIRNTGIYNTITGASFSSSVFFNVGSNPSYVQFADFDKDGRDDIGIANSSSNTISILRNNSSVGTITSSTLAARVDFSVGVTPYSFTVNDFNNDGKIDIATANYSSNTISLLQNNSTYGVINASSFGTPVDFTIQSGNNPYIIQSGDIDGDGKPDLAVGLNSGGYVSVFKNLWTSGNIGQQSFKQYSYRETNGSAMPGIAIADLDADAKPELLAGNLSYNRVSIFKNYVGQSPATVTSINPTSGSTLSTFVTISGSGFINIAQVNFGDGNALQFNVVNASTIVARVPFGATTGPISVINTFGGVAMSTGNFTPLPATLVTITGIAPPLAAPGSSIVISGNNFNSVPGNNKVYFGGALGAVTAASSTSLTVLLPPGANKNSVVVLNTGLGMSAQSDIPTPTIFPNSNTINGYTFDAPINLSTGGSTYYSATGDLDGDGKNDIVVANYSSNNVLVYRNISSVPGVVSFAAGVSYTVGNNPYGLAIGDLDNDGKLDIAVGNYSSNTISILRNNCVPGTLSFAAKVDFAGSSPYGGLAIGDIDGDGAQDIAVSNYYSSSVSILRNNNIVNTITAASFSTRFDLNIGSYVNNVEIADIDGDGKKDLAAANIGNYYVTMFRNIGQPGDLTINSFSAKVDITGFSSPTSVKFADLDADSKPDMIVSNYSGNTISVIKNQGTAGTLSTATFPVKINFVTNANPSNLIVRDFDGDGRIDIASSNASSMNVSVFRNLTNNTITAATFASRADFGTGSGPIGLSEGDLDGDGEPELIVPNSGTNNLSILRNRTSGTPTITGFAPTSGQPGITQITLTGNSLNAVNSITIGIGKTTNVLYATNNTVIAIVPPSASTGSVSVSSFFNRNSTSPGIFTISAAYPYPTITAISPSVAQVSNSVTLSGNNFASVAGANIVYFGSTRAMITAANPTSIVATVPSYSSYQQVTLLNTITGLTGVYRLPFINTFVGANTLTGCSFDSRIDAFVPSYSFSSATGDLDGDGKPELVVTNYYTSSISVLKNNAPVSTITASSFSTRFDYSSPSNPYKVVLSDIDNDGKLDIIISNYTGQSISIYRNNSTGTINASSFASRTDLQISGNVYGLDVKDVDLDGRADIVAADYTNNKISIFRNRSISGTITGNSFESNIDFATGVSPYDVEVVDIDGDSKPEVVVSNYSSNYISVFHNKSIKGFIDNTSFSTAANVNSVYNITSVKSGDIDGDGKLDIITTNYNNNSISLYRNVASPGTITGTSLAPKVDISTSSTARSSAIGDLDGDGKVDLAVAIEGNSRLAIYKNVSLPGSISGTSLRPYVEYPTYSSAYSPAIADMDGDGVYDLSVSSISYLNLFKNMSGVIPTVTGVSPLVGIAGVTVITVNGGGFNNLTSITVGSGSTSNINLLNSSTLTFLLPVEASNSNVVISNCRNVSAISMEVITVTAFPYPTITSVLPNVAANGESIVISGNNFSTIAGNNQVYFGNIKAIPTFSTISTIGVNVPIGSTYQPLKIYQSANKLLGFSTIPFINTFTGMSTITGATYAPKVDFAAGSYPYTSALGDLDGDGKLDLVVANFYSYTVSVYRNTSSVGTITASSFPTRQDFSVGVYPFEVELADLDMDGKLDIVVANYNSATISILKNNTSIGSINASSFASKVDLTSNSNCYGLAIGDIDLDGRPDIVAANYGNNSISLFKNNIVVGTITSTSFLSKQDIFAGYNPYDVELSDLDGDGKLDIILANYGSSLTTILKNKAVPGTLVTNSFAAPINYSVPNTCTNVRAGDLDGDGKNDIILAGYTSTNVFVLRNKSIANTLTGTSFDTAIPLPVGSNPYGVALADLNGDGRVDIVSGNSGLSTVSVLQNNAVAGTITAASFSTKLDLSVGANPGLVSIGDIDGDGKPEIVSPNYGANTVSVLRTNLASFPTIAGFTPASGVPLYTIISIGGYNLNNVTQVKIGVGIANNYTILGASSILALVPISASTGQVVVTNNQGNSSTAPGIFTVNPIDLITITGISPTEGPVNSSIIVNGNYFNTMAGNNIVYMGPVKAAVTSATATTLSVTVPYGANYNELSVLNTGINLGTSYVQPFIPTFAGGGTITGNTFTTGTSLYNGYYNLYSSAIADFDLDGKPDVVTTYYGGNSVLVQRNISTTGTITSTSLGSVQPFTTSSNPVISAIADFDNDGRLDIAVSCYGSQVVSVLKNTSSPGTISFAAKVDFTTGNYPYGVVADDIDGDGFVDIVVANSNSNTISILRNQNTINAINTGSFAAKVDYPANVTPYFIATKDLDQDGKKDIVVGNYSSNNVSVYKNRSSVGTINASSLSSKVDFATQNNPIGIKLADIESDGKPDIIVANSGNSSISILRNMSSGGTITGTSFATRVNYSTNSTPYGITVEDLDGDAKIDLAVSNYTSSNISIFKNISVNTTINGASFSAPVSLPSLTNPMFLTSGDMDSDGKPELIVPGNTSYQIYIHKNLILSTAPSISGVNPATATAGLTTVSISGSNFVQINQVSFGNGIADNYTVVGTGLIIAQLPASAATGTITVSNTLGTTATISGVLTVNPMPVTTITSVSPLYASAGTSVIINGANFGANVSENVVFFGATKGQVTAASTTSLTVLVPFGSTYEELTVENTVTNLTAAYRIPFVATFAGTGTITSNNFSPRLDLSTSGADPYGSLLADLDGDGKADLISANFSGYNINVFRNIAGVGTLTGSSFGSAQSFAVGTLIFEVIASDIDADGKPDLVGFGNNGQFISILKNISTLGNIAFSPYITFATETTGQGFAVGDLDMDGRPDIVTGGNSNTISVLRNTGIVNTITAASFAPRVNFTVNSGIYDVEIADFNNDGKPEILTVSQNSYTFSILQNNTFRGVINSSSFAPQITKSTGSYPVWIKAADFDNDARLDIAVANYSSNSISVYKNIFAGGSITGGSFSPNFDFSTGGSPNAITVGDVDGDGRVDIVSGNYNGSTISILRNTTTSSITGTSFTSRTDLATGGATLLPYIGDIDGDEKSDIIVAVPGTDKLSIFRNNTIMAPTITGFSPTSAVPGTLVTISGENLQNINQIKFGTANAIFYTVLGNNLLMAKLPTNAITGIIAVVSNQGATGSSGGVFTVLAAPVPVITSITPLAGPANTFLTIDGLNFSPVGTDNYVYVGGQKVSTVSSASNRIVVQVPANANYQALIYVNASTGLQARYGVPYLINFAGSGTITGASFSNATNFTTSANPLETQLADFDGDGKTDMIYTNASFNTVSIRRNLLNTNSSISGTGFDTPVNFATGTTPTQIALGDIDADGKLDFAVSNANSNTITIFRNKSVAGSIVFDNGVSINGGNYTSGIILADIDLDGYVDMITSNASDYTFSIFKNNAISGTITANNFAPRVNYNTGAYPYYIKVADIDADNKPEVIISNTNSFTVQVFKNISTIGNIDGGTFATPVSFTTQSYPSNLGIADLDRDGRPDVIVNNTNSNSFSVFRNANVNGTITSASFNSRVDFATATYPQGLAFADFDGDGKPDIVVTNQSSNSLSVYRNLSSVGGINTSSFASKFDIGTSASPYNLAAGDLNGDSKADLVVPCYSAARIAVYENISTPPISPVITNVNPGAAREGKSITLSGINFTNATNVAFAGSNSQFSVLNGSTIVATVPGGANTGVITVTNFAGIGVSASFTVLPTPSPTILGISPAFTTVGTMVTVSGIEFDNLQSPITFAGISITSFSRPDNNTLIFNIPLGANSGHLRLRTLYGGISPTVTGSFITVLQAPTIVDFGNTSPLYGNKVAFGGCFSNQASIITIAGNNFYPANTQVFVNNYQSTATTITSNLIYASVPNLSNSPGTNITGRIRISTPAGTINSTANLSVIFCTATPTTTIGLTLGSTFGITGNDLPNITNTSVGGVAASFYTYLNALYVTVPNNAPTGIVDVSLRQSGYTYTFPFPFLIYPKPTVTGISPLPAPVGSVITLTGTALTSTSGILFNGASQYTINNINDNKVSLVVPPGAQNGYLTIYAIGGSASSNVQFFVAPTVTGISPGAQGVGRAVDIAGNSLNGVTQVLFNGVSGLINWKNNSNVNVTVPVGATSGNLVVISPNYTSPGIYFTVIPPPVITNITPGSASGDMIISISGANFSLSGVNYVSFNGSGTSIATIIGDNLLLVPVPQNASSGFITVSNNGGSTTSTNQFAVLPSLTGVFSPSSAGGGAYIAVYGKNLLNPSLVRFNGVAASGYNSVSATQVNVYVPSGAGTGPVSVDVTTDGGTSNQVVYTILGIPTITNVTPGSGIAFDRITITGTNFLSANSVLINGAAASVVTTVGNTVIATVPTIVNAGVGIVQLQNAGNQYLPSPLNYANSPGNFSVIPSIITITSGYCTGFPGCTYPIISAARINAYIRITGYDFLSGAQVFFNGVLATPSYITGNEIFVTVPTGAVTGNVSVRTSGGTSAGKYFTILPPPTVDAFAPLTGTAGTIVTITGTEFSNVTAVRFGSATAGFVPISNSMVIATLPGTAGQGKVYVDADGGTGTSVLNFVPIPVISSLNYYEAPVNSSISVYGTNLNDVASINFNGGITSNFSNYSTQLVVSIPSNAKTGLVSVSAIGGTAFSPAIFTVSSISGISVLSGIAGDIVSISGSGITSASSYAFDGTISYSIVSTATGIVVVTTPGSAEYGKITLNFPNGGTTSSPLDFAPTPVIAQVAPYTHGTLQYIDLIGTNLREASMIKFNGIAASNTGYPSGSNRMQVQVPSNALSGTLMVTVTGGGTATSPLPFTVISITGIIPATGLADTQISILGANLDDPTSVTIGGNTVSGINPASTSSLLITTIPGTISSGQVIVYKGGGYNNSFGINLPNATITSINPVNGPVGTIITVSGFNFTAARNVFIYNASHSPYNYPLAYTVINANTIVATVSGAAITGNIYVTGQNTNNVAGPMFTLPPVLTALPAPGVLPSGQYVTLYGNNLTSPSTITVGGVVISSGISYGANSISFTMPTSVGSNLVIISNSAGSSQASFGFFSITSLSTTAGVAGAVISISGTSFGSVSGVRFNNVPAQYQVVTSNMVIATVPGNAGNGVVSLSSGAYVVNSATIFRPIPVITGFLVTNGIDASTAIYGSRVSLAGTNLNNVNNVVLGTGPNVYDPNPGVFVSNPCYSPNGVTFISNMCVPANAASGIIYASNGVHTATFGGFNFIAPPGTISGIAATPGSQVTITGIALNTITAINFGGVPASSFTQVNASSAIVSIPLNASISGVLVVQTLGGNTSATYTAPPFITGFSKYATAAGMPVQIFGQNLDSFNSVAFVGTVVGGSFSGTASSGSITVIIPPQASTGPLTVTNPAGSNTSTNSFTILPLPTISSFTPMNGGDGTLVVINGTDMESVSGVYFNNGNQLATIIGISANQISVIVPNGVLSGKIGLSNSNIYPSIIYSSANYLGTPIFTSVINLSNNNAPYIGAVGESIQINGSNFTNPSVVLFNGVPASGLTYNSSNQLTAVVPVGASSGLISVSTPGGNLTTPNSFAVVNISAISAIVVNSCAGAGFQVLYTVSGIFPSDNTFFVDLMNGGSVVSSGIGSRISNTSGTVSAILPGGAVGNYQVRIRSASAATNYSLSSGNSNTFNISNINNWVGGYSAGADNWNIMQNWGCNMVPASSSYVIIPAISPSGYMPVIYGSAVAGKMDINGQLSMTTSGILSLYGDLKITNGVLDVADNSYVFINGIVKTQSNTGAISVGNVNIGSNNYLTLNSPLLIKGSLVNNSTNFNATLYQGINTNTNAVTVQGMNFQTIGSPGSVTTFDELILNNPFTGAGIALAGPVNVKCKFTNHGIFSANGFLTEFINGGPCVPIIDGIGTTTFADIKFSNTTITSQIKTPIRVRGNFINSIGAQGITMTTSAGVDFVGNTSAQTIDANNATLEYADFNITNPLGVILSTATGTRLKIRGSFRNDGVFTDLTNTISFTGANTTIGGRGEYNLNNIEVGNNAGVILKRPVKVRGNFRIDGSFEPGKETVTFNATSVQSVFSTATVTFAGIDIEPMASVQIKAPVKVRGNFRTQGTVVATVAAFVGDTIQKIQGTGNYTLGDMSNTNAAGLLVETSLTIKGNLINNGSLTASNTNEITFSGINQTIGGSTMADLNAINVSTGSGIKLAAPMKVRGNFKMDGTFAPNNQTVNFANIIVSAETQLQSNNAINVVGDVVNDGNVNVPSGITLSGSSIQNIAGTGILSTGTITNNNLDTILGINLSVPLLLTGDLNNNSAFESTSAISFTGASQAIRGNTEVVLNDVAILPSASVSLQKPIKVKGNFKNNSLTTGLSANNSIVTLDGNTEQNVGGTQPTAFAGLVVNNPAGASVSQPISVTGLTLGGGNLTMGSNVGPLVISSTNNDALVRTSDAFIVGDLTRGVSDPSGAIEFPIGKPNKYRGAIINFTSSASGAGFMTVSHTDAVPGNKVGMNQPFDSAMYARGLETLLPMSWSIDPSIGVTGGTYNVAFDARISATSFSDAAGLQIVKRHTANDSWESPGISGLSVYDQSTGVLSISRTSITGFSQYAIAGSCQNISRAADNQPIITQINDSLVCSVIASNYEWSKNGVVLRGISTRQIKPTLRLEELSARYQVRALINGCYSNTSDEVVFSSPGINSTLSLLSATVDISIYPNPAANSLVVSMKNALPGAGQIFIYNMIGKSVLMKTLKESALNHRDETIDISSLPTGIYFIKVIINKEAKVIKLTIER